MSIEKEKPDFPKTSGEKTWVTRPLFDSEPPPPAEGAFPRTAPAPKEVFPKTAPVGEAAFPKTAPLARGGASSPGAGEGGFSPTLGWVVCVKGKKRGRDFRITAEKCYLGRGQSNDIVLDFDPTISRESHVILAYNRMDGSFWLDVSQSKNNVYRGKELILAPVRLSPRDVFTVGETSLMLVPLCDETFRWDREAP